MTELGPGSPPPSLRDAVDVPALEGPPIRLDCDALVVGSGAGGATAAAALAEAGLGVIVLEEGPLYETPDFGPNVLEMIGRLMRDGGTTLISGRRHIPYLEGRCVGGSTVVNGGMCWRTPEKILDDWVRSRGLDQLSPKRLEPLFEEVERTIDARHQDPGSDGSLNDAFRRGAEALGWELSKNRRNQVHCVGSNECVTGCPSGAKQSTVVNWLPRAIAAGARLIPQMRVQRLVFDGGRVVGADGMVVDQRARMSRRRFSVRARAVAFAGGAVQTPLALLRNGLGRRNRHIGQHFTVHPNVKVVAAYDGDFDAMRGVHQGWQCVEFADRGFLLAPGNVPLALATVAFESFGAELAERMRGYRHLAMGGVLVEDSAEGSIRVGPLGLPRVRYDVTDVDQDRFIEAVGRMAELHFAAGAVEVYTPFHTFPVVATPDDIARLRTARPRVRDTEYFTAHIMGTCRMHAAPGAGVVDPDGAVRDVPGLYLADASVLPSPVGVNPQVTIMALALRIGRRLAETLTVNNRPSRASSA